MRIECIASLCLLGLVLHVRCQNPSVANLRQGSAAGSSPAASVANSGQAANNLEGTSVLFRPLHKVRSVLFPFIQDNGVDNGAASSIYIPASKNPSIHNPIQLIVAPFHMLRKHMPFFASMQDSLSSISPIQAILPFNLLKFGHGFRAPEEIPPINLVMEDLAVAQSVVTGVNYLAHDVNSLIEGLIVAKPKAVSDDKKATEQYNTQYDPYQNGYSGPSGGLISNLQSGGILSTLQNGLRSNIQSAFSTLGLGSLLSGESIAIPNFLTGGTINVPNLLGMAGGGLLQTLGLVGMEADGAAGNPVAALLENVVGAGKQIVSSILPGLITDSSLNLQSDLTRRTVRSAEQVEADIGALSTVFSGGRNIPLVNSVTAVEDTVTTIKYRPNDAATWASIVATLRQLYRDLLRLSLAYELSQQQTAATNASKIAIADLLEFIDRSGGSIDKKAFSEKLKKLGAALAVLQGTPLALKSSGPRKTPLSHLTPPAAAVGGGFPIQFGDIGKLNAGFNVTFDIAKLEVPIHVDINLPAASHTAATGKPDLASLESLYAERVAVLPVTASQMAAIVKMLEQLRTSVRHSVETVAGVQIEGVLGPDGGVLGIGKILGLERAIESASGLLKNLEDLQALYGFERTASVGGRVNHGGRPQVALSQTILKKLGNEAVKSFAARRLQEEATQSAGSEDEDLAGAMTVDAFKIAGYVVELAEFYAQDITEILRTLLETFTCDFAAVNQDAVHLLQAAALAGDAVTVMKAVNATPEEFAVALNPFEASRKQIVLEAAHPEPVREDSSKPSVDPVYQRPASADIPGPVGDLCNLYRKTLQASNAATGLLLTYFNLAKFIASTSLNNVASAQDMFDSVMEGQGAPFASVPLPTPPQ